MATVTELTPLSGYTASVPIDINDKGHVVGKSFEAAQPSWLPPSQATLWADGKVIPLFKSPGPEWQNSSEALRIGWEGRVLCARLGSEKSYYVWRNETEPALDVKSLVNDLKETIDFNDKGQLLVTRKAAAPQIYNLTTNRGRPTTLPPFPPKSNQYHEPKLIGIANNGYVVAFWSSKVISGTGATGSLIGYWHPRNPSKWSELAGPPSPFFEPVLTKSGFILATTGDATKFLPYYYDLNLVGKPQAVFIPLVPGGDGPIGVYLDATSDGRMVGGEGGSDYRPTFHDRNINQSTGLAKHFDSPWKPSYGVGIAGDRIVGSGEMSGSTRGWILDLALVGRPPGRRPDFGFLAMIDPMWRIFPIPPPPPPLDMLSDLLQTMKPEERGRVLARARDLEAHFKNLGNVIQKGGGG